jgi:hypothetical protein
MKALDALDKEEVRNKFDLSLIMYAKPFASPKNLIAVEALKDRVKQSKLPQIDQTVIQKANIGANIFKLN